MTKGPGKLLSAEELMVIIEEVRLWSSMSSIGEAAEFNALYRLGYINATVSIVPETKA